MRRVAVPKRRKPQNRHESRQDYETPAEFITALERRYDRTIDVDLACTVKTARAPRWYAGDSLSIDWREAYGPKAMMWCNPPYKDITPWARKSSTFGPALTDLGQIHLLVLASVGSDWFRYYVHGRALVEPLSPRLIFRGEKEPFPKDLMLCTYGAHIEPGFAPWRWK